MRFIDSREVSEVVVLMVAASLDAGHAAPAAVRSALAAVRADLLADIDATMSEAHEAAVGAVGTLS